MTLSQEETGPSNGNRDTTSLLGEQVWSNRDQADENEVNGVSTRRRKLTEKGRAFVWQLEGYRNILKLSCRPLAFTSY